MGRRGSSSFSQKRFDLRDKPSPGRLVRHRAMVFRFQGYEPGIGDALGQSQSFLEGNRVVVSAV
jgi:hypothetical protein